MKCAGADIIPDSLTSTNKRLYLTMQLPGRVSGSARAAVRQTLYRRPEINAFTAGHRLKRNKQECSGKSRLICAGFCNGTFVK